MPTLLIWGESEKLLPYESIDFFRQYLPGSAEIRVVKGFGHVPQMERPGELVRHLIDFADRFSL
ncbi:MAG TPA: alpha/beta hydrolase, partial [Myxococcales bacterium]|nr:alpha/beta hydrolase [Myxococcales bacterium]